MGRTDAEFTVNSKVMDPVNLTAAATWVVAGQFSDHPCSGGRRLGIFSDGPSNATVCIRWVLDCQSGGGRFLTESSSHPRITLCSDAGVER